MCIASVCQISFSYYNDICFSCLNSLLRNVHRCITIFLQMTPTTSPIPTKSHGHGAQDVKLEKLPDDSRPELSLDNLVTKYDIPSK